MNVTVNVVGGLGIVALNRPERKNAITGPLGVELADALERLSDDDAVSVVLFHGSGGAFCSGLDIKEFNADPPPDWLKDFKDIWRRAHLALFNCRKPIIGALERYAINGGAALAIACDYLIAGEESFLQVGEVQQGMAAPYNLAWLRLRHTESVAAEVAYIGRRMSGPELVQKGIAGEAVADRNVLERATELATQMAEYPSGALPRIKAGIRSYAPQDPNEWFDTVANTIAGASGKPSKQKG